MTRSTSFMYCTASSRAATAEPDPTTHLKYRKVKKNILFVDRYREESNIKYYLYENLSQNRNNIQFLIDAYVIRYQIKSISYFNEQNLNIGKESSFNCHQFVLFCHLIKSDHSQDPSGR